ncbi:MAG: LuxR C-terminal-related transcriptional regulator [Coriobacteriia bacterium]|nr:LuxR C-terminal-related transcriptional regulator [Coriobacteriia bacterium]
MSPQKNIQKETIQDVKNALVKADADTQQKSFQQKTSFAEDLIKQWPALPYFSLGIWLAWAYIAFGGTFWFPNTEHASVTMSWFYIVSVVAFGATLLVMPFALNVSKRILSSKWTIIGAGGIASLGCIMAFASNLTLAPSFMSQAQILFYIGAVFRGIGTAVFVMKIGELFGMLPPRLNFLYAALSQIVLSVIFALLMGMPLWSPFANSPSLAVIIAFCALPLLAALLASISCKETRAKATAHNYETSFRYLPPEFWRLIILTFILALMTYALKAMFFAEQSSVALYNGGNYAVLLDVLFAFVLIVLILRLSTRHLNFGKIIFTTIIILAASIACLSVLESPSPLWSSLFFSASGILEFLTWSILAIVVFQRNISPILVFGFGRGGFMLACALGWVLGTFVFPSAIDATNSIVFWLICASVLLLAAFLLFSEKTSERLFLSDDDSERSFEKAMHINTLKENSKQEKWDEREKRNDFEQAVERLAKSSGLSARETETFSYLAKGYSSNAIAEKLQVSWNTARSHTQNVYVKLNIHSRQELILLLEKEAEAL